MTQPQIGQLYQRNTDPITGQHITSHQHTA